MPNRSAASARPGVDSVEHAWLADRAAIEARRRVGRVPRPDPGRHRRQPDAAGLTPVQRERQDLIERRHRASTEAAIELGIPLATGTDTGEVGVTADMVAREIALLHDHGASARWRRSRRRRARRRASSGSIDEIGTVEPG